MALILAAPFPAPPSSGADAGAVEESAYAGLVVKLLSHLPPHGLWPTRLLCPWDFPGKNAGVGCHLLHQGIFATQGSNPGLPH